MTILFVVGEIDLFVFGHRAQCLQSLEVAAGLALLMFLTHRFTLVQESAPKPKRTTMLLQISQLAVCLVIWIAGISKRGIWDKNGFYLGPAPGGLPGWTQLIHVAHNIVASMVPAGIFRYGTDNFFEDVILITVPLLLLGVPWREFGFYRLSQGSGKVLIAWLVAPFAFFAYVVLTRQIPLVGMLKILASNLLQNGFSEEFLWRGAILGRLRTLFAEHWALLIQALAFGAWHYGADMGAMRQNLIAAVGAMIAVQAVFGFAMGFLYLRTRNLLIPTLFHLSFDSLGSFIS